MRVMEQTGKLLLRSSPSEDTKPEMGLLLGHALAVEYGKVVVGMDLMKSSPMMKSALIAGLVSSGADVIDIGVVSEPVAALAARMGDCCVYITEFRQLDLISGYLLIDKDGCYFGKDQIMHLNHISEEEIKKVDYKALGSVKHYYNAISDYNKKLIECVNNNTGGSVILNCNCGLATDSAPQALNHIGTDVVSINAQKDRNFVSDSLSTKEADNRPMKALVEAYTGSIGISINRIGTLLRVFDESGEPLKDHEILALLILYLRPKKIVVPMDMTWMIQDLFSGKIDVKINTPNPMPDALQEKFIVSSPSAGAIHKAMVENDADLSYYDGGFVFKEMSLTPDAIFGSVILSQFSENNNMKNVLSEIPKYYSEQKDYKISCSHEDFIRMMETNLPDVSPTKTYDNGHWRVDMPGGGFFLCFDEDQKDTVRMIAESSDRAYLISLLEVIDNLIDSCAAGQ
jgi:phosphoglucosamine mutase